MAGEPTVICAWCGKILARGVGEVTHGICGECADRLLAVIDDIGTKLGANLPDADVEDGDAYPAPDQRDRGVA